MKPAKERRCAVKPRREGRSLDRAEILATAERLIARRGVEWLTLRNLALELGVTPAAVSWHVRSKDQLLQYLVDAAFSDLAPPSSRQGPWQRRVRQLSLWFRQQLLARRGIVQTPAFWNVLLYAFPQVGFAGRDILKDAGFTGARLALASRTVYWHTMAFVLQETMLGGAPGQTPELALDRALRRLRVEELAVYMQTRAQAIQIDGDELFGYSVDRLLEGLAADLAAHPARRARRGT